MAGNGKVQVQVLIDSLTAGGNVYRAGDVRMVSKDHPLATMARDGTRLGPTKQLAARLLTTESRKRSGPAAEHARAVMVQRKKGGYGDVLMTSVAVRALRQSAPEAWITYAVPEKYGDSQVNNPDASEVVIWNGDERDRPEAEYDQTFDLTTVDAEYEAAASPAVRKSRIDLYLEMVGCSTDLKVPFYKVEPEEAKAAQSLVGDGTRLRIGVEPRSNSLLRDVPPDTMAQAAAHLAREMDAEIWVLDHAMDVPFPVPNARRACGLKFREAAAVMAKMDACIVLDSGLLHLAAALGVRSVALFGPTDPRCRVTTYPGILPVWGVTRCIDAPCWNQIECQHRKCLDFPAEDIYWAVRRILSDAGRAD